MIGQLLTGLPRHWGRYISALGKQGPGVEQRLRSLANGTLPKGTGLCLTPTEKVLGLWETIPDNISKYGLQLM